MIFNNLYQLIFRTLITTFYVLITISCFYPHLEWNKLTLGHVTNHTFKPLLSLGQGSKSATNIIHNYCTGFCGTLCDVPCTTSPFYWNRWCFFWRIKKLLIDFPGIAHIWYLIPSIIGDAYSNLNLILPSKCWK